ncbi:TniQ family protein [Streptomyces sp. NPDC048389]|uniref:TniQ family protein n=1 Tax=Streptomyces sp. NPDC048389 TaxID=3154622 RepID=UPI003456B542
MTQGTTGSPTRARSTNKPLNPADLPIRVPLIPGETTLSFLTRTATANGQDLAPLLKTLHRGRLTLPKDEPRPQRHEAFLSTEAADRLAVLTGRPAEQIQRALPNTRAPHLLGTQAAAVRLEPWPDELGAGPLAACPLCMEDGARLVAGGHRWRPCPCGRRWMGGDDGGYLLDTGPAPELSRALLRHRAFDHRLGAVGDALVADAHQVALWWWVNRQVAHERWREREEAVGFTRHRRRAAPAIVYPETMLVAEAMDQWEQRRHARSAVPGEWLEDLAARLDTPGLVDGRENEPLRYWLELHPAAPGLTTTGRTPAERRWAQLPTLHHRPAERGPFQARSCLRWTFGRPLTSTLEICSYCQGRAPSCYWTPADDCPSRPQPNAG